MKTPAAMLKRLIPLIACFCLAAPLSAADKKIVLIAGPPSHGPGELEFNAGVLLLKKCLDGVPGVKVEEYRNGCDLAGLGIKRRLRPACSILFSRESVSAREQSCSSSSFRKAGRSPPCR